MMNNPKVIAQVHAFMKNGKFMKSASPL